MYGGTQRDVILEFNKKLAGAVFDRFGEGVHMIPSGEEKMYCNGLHPDQTHLPGLAIPVSRGNADTLTF